MDRPALLLMFLLVTGCATHANEQTGTGHGNYAEREEVSLFISEMVEEVMVINLTPSFNVAALSVIVESKTVKGIVLQMFGAGNGPSNGEQKLVNILQRARELGIIVVATSQCLKGSVILSMYSVSDAFAKAGVISAGDMTQGE